MSVKEFSLINIYLCLNPLMSTALLNLDFFADAPQEFFKVDKNTGEKMFAKYICRWRFRKNNTKLQDPQVFGSSI